jgi:ABC-type multidrug transport system fused ATPase/permease subunit
MTRATRTDLDSSRRGLSAVELRRLFRLAAPQAWAAPVLVALGFAASLAETVGITLVVVFLYVAMGRGADAPATGGLLDPVFAAVRTHLGDGGSVAIAGLVFVLIAAKAAFGLAYTLVSARVRNQLSEVVRNGLHRRFLESPYAEIRRHDQGYLLNLLSTSSWSIADACMSATRVLINLCSIVVFGAFMLGLSWQLTAVAAAGATALFLVLRRLSGRARRLGAHGREVNQGLAERTLVVLQGMRTIRAFAQEPHYQATFERASAEARATGLALERLYALIHPATEVGYFALLCLIVAVAEAGGVAFATTLACVALLYRLQPHMRELEGNVIHLAQLEPEIRSVLVMLQVGSTGPASGGLPFTGMREGVQFAEVTLTHSGAAQPALARASFSIPVGCTTAIVGESGAGKTTVVNLLLRLYAADGGAVLVDGVPLERLSRSDWLSRTAVAGQDVELVEGTVAENIRMARPEASDAEVRAAAELAGALGFVEALPDGFESWIGQQGLNLSGGQRQRLGIARAVLGDPDLLILDEATNALDAALDDGIRAGLRRAFAGRTLVLVTHREEAALEADHVVRLQGGRVIASGAPDAVLGPLHLGADMPPRAARPEVSPAAG